MRVGFTHWIYPHGVIRSGQEDSAWSVSMTRFESHLEGVLLAIDVGIEVNPAIAELGGADVTDPSGDIAAAEVMAVMTVHEVVIHAQIGAGRSERCVASGKRN